ncbi:MAG: hypothetical protein LAN84_00265 [Acidobacteriia bacterium]|nr:hypothetical protein [Terriglobia bacterium]
MPYTIEIRRGLKANLPASAALGEPLFCTDTHELFVGTGTGVVKVEADAATIQGIAVMAQAPADGQLLIFDGATQKYVPGDPIVSGPDAPGSVPTRPPVQAGAFDGTNVQRLKSNASGQAEVVFPSPQAVTGPLTDTQMRASAVPVSAAALPLPGGAATEASLGTDGAAPPSIPGTGIRGWLRSIYDKLAGTLSQNVAQWGGAAVAAATTSPVGSEAAPVVRSIQRKYTNVVTTTPPAANTTTYYPSSSTWYDSMPTGATIVECSFYANVWQNASSDGCYIECTDDPNGNAALITQATGGYLTAQFGTFVATLVKRYWRVKYINGNVSPNSFEIATTEYAGSSPIGTGPGGSLFFYNVNQYSNTDGQNAFWSPWVSTDGVNLRSALLGVMPQLVKATGAGLLTEMPRTPGVYKTIAAVSVTAGTPATLWTPTAGKKFRLMGYALSLSVAGSVILLDSATEVIRTPLLAAGIGQNSPHMGNGILSSAANNALKADVSASGTVSGFVFGTEE